MRILTVFLLLCGTACADGMTEVNTWRKHVGLPLLKEDKELTKFAQMKAEFRAQRRLHDGHQGPRWPEDCTEGSGESLPMWGFLTCIIECEGEYAGAGIASDGRERYMVLVIRNCGRSLINPNNIPILDTSHLTPNPPTFR